MDLHDHCQQTARAQECLVRSSPYKLDSVATKLDGNFGQQLSLSMHRWVLGFESIDAA